jgi:hypothetical protein
MAEAMRNAMNTWEGDRGWTEDYVELDVDRVSR